MPTLSPPRIGRPRAILALGLALWAAGGAGQAIADPPPGPCCDTLPWEASDPVPRCPWYTSSEGIALRREFRGIGPVATEGPSPTGTVALSRGSLDEPFQAGARLMVGHTFDDSPYQVEASYFWLTTLDTSAQTTDPAYNLFSPFTHFGVPADSRVDNNDFVEIREVSRLESGEVDLKCVVPLPAGCPTTVLLFGVRHVGIREEFDYLSQPKTSPPVTVHAHTVNNLWGPQIGGLVDFGHDGAWLHIEGKAAICNNAVDRDLDASVDGTGYTHPRLSQSGTAFVGDASACILWRPTSSMSAKIGYQALWCDELALAARNFDPDLASLTDSAAQPPINRRGTVVYHGPFAGLQFSW